MKKADRLMNKNFFLLWQGQAISALGMQGFSIATLFWIKHATDSATLMGLMMMLSNLPAVLLGPIGGAYADRYSRRAVIITCDLVDGLAVLTLAGLTYFVPNQTNLILTWIFIISLLISIMGAFFNPAIVAAIPDLVPGNRVMSANSLTQISLQTSVFIGQGVGGTLLRILGAPLLFLINSITYLFAAVSESFVTIPQTIPEKSMTWKEELKTFGNETLAGLKYVWGVRGLRNLVFSSAFLNFFSVPVIMLLPFYVEDTLKVSVDWYGWILAAYGIGSMLGYMAAGVLKLAGRRRMIFMVIFMCLEAFGYGFLGAVLNPYLAITLASLGGFVGGFISINITTIMQIATPADIRGRVFGLLSTISGGISPIAMGLSGILADMTGQNIPLIYLMCGFFMVLLTALVTSSRDFRTFLCYEMKEETNPEVKPSAVTVN